MKKIGIYVITAPNGKVYVGASTNIKRRWADHKHNRRIGKTNLCKSFREFGVDKHSFEILEECKVDKLLERETFWKTQYLSKVGDDMSQVLFHQRKDANKMHSMSKSTKAKLSKSAQIGKANSTYSAADDLERNSNIGKAHLGMKRSAQAKLNMRVSKPTRWRKVAQFTLDGKFIRFFDSITKAADSLGKRNGGIAKCCKGYDGKSPITTAHGYKWEYADE